MERFTKKHYLSLDWRGRLAFTHVICASLQKLWSEIAYRNMNEDDFRRVFPPIVCLVQSKQYLGRWLGFCRTIEINLDLVLEHPWYAVLDVFYHETAHSLVDILYPGAVETAHGPKFCEICKKIGANPAAATEITELDVRLFSKKETADDSAIDKVKKLLVLAENGDSNEAEVALSKAMLLMSKHGIKQEDLTPEDEFTTITLGKPSKRMSFEVRNAAAVLEDFWSVKVVLITCPSPEDVLKKQEASLDNKMLSISGTKQNVSIASYVYDYIMNHVDVEWEKFRKKEKLPALRRLKRDFSLGFINGIRDKLTLQLKDRNVYAMVVSAKAKMKGYVAARYPALVRNKIRGRSVEYAGIMYAGKEAGRNISIHAGVKNVKDEQKLLK